MWCRWPGFGCLCGTLASVGWGLEGVHQTSAPRALLPSLNQKASGSQRGRVKRPENAPFGVAKWHVKVLAPVEQPLRVQVHPARRGGGRAEELARKCRPRIFGVESQSHTV